MSTDLIEERRLDRGMGRRVVETEELPAGLGWLPDLPDFRDYTMDSPSIRDAVAKVKVGGTAFPDAHVGTAPATADLRGWFSPVENQGALGSCTANAGVGIVEYFERRAFGRHIDASRLFLYKATRNLLGWTGDTGAFLRSTMGALVLFGVPPERYWPYRIADFEKEPPAFCYAFAENYHAISYYRLDPPGTARDTLLGKIKTQLAGGLPAMFGFTVYSSISQAASSGKIPLPDRGERVVGGHAVAVAGYDDNLRIRNSASGAETVGALLIRNSWGTGWGDDGYGWLPYEYVLRGLATDWWSLVKASWIDTGAFAQ